MADLIDYLEYPASNMEVTKTFFEAVFNWHFENYGPDYMAFSGGGLDGGFYRSELASKEQNGGPLMVFVSDDLDASRHRVESAGGVIVKDIFTFPGGRRFQFTEPSGNEMGVWSKV